MGTLLGLAARMNAEADRLEEYAHDAAVYLAHTIAYDLIDTTPVDTSRALSNWLISLGSPSNVGTIDFAKGVSGSTKGTSAAGAKARVDAALAAKVPGQSIFISNVVRYIVYLNRGHSGQAPAMFVENSVLRGRMKLRQRIDAGGFRK